MRLFALPERPSSTDKSFQLKMSTGKHSAIHKAAKKGDASKVLMLLRKNPGINADALNSDGKTALYIACDHGYSSVAGVLLRAGADVNLKCGPLKQAPLRAVASLKRTPLHAAACNGHWGMLRVLVEAGGDLSMTTSEGLAVHHLAILADSPDGLRQLVKLTPDLDVRGHDGATALMVCAGYFTRMFIRNAPEKAQILLDGGARSDIISDKGDTAIVVAAWWGVHGVVKVLLDAGASCSDRTKKGWTALMIAAREGHLEVVRLLRDAGAALSDHQPEGLTAMMMAAAKGQLEVVRFLCEAGADISACDCNGWTAMINAAAYGNVEIVRFLCDAGADSAHRSTGGVTALMIAAAKGHLEVVRLLRDAKRADISDRSDVGWTALMFAARAGHLKIVQLLHDAGVDICDRDVGGHSALLRAAAEGHSEIVRYLLDAGSDLSDRNEGGASPLHAAAFVGHTEIVRELISAGADVNHKSSILGVFRSVPTDIRRTAMHIAVCHGHVDTVRVLLVEGSLETATDVNGCRPACLMREAWAETDPSKKAWMRLSLARAPAFRACSWLWPTESTSEISTGIAVREEGEIDDGLKKTKRIPLHLGVFRHRRRHWKDTLKILVRYLKPIYKYCT